MPPRPVIPLLQLNNCRSIPCFALGTWKANPKKVGEAVKTAILECGYNHIDCAHVYGNEKQVGEALGKLFTCHGVKREDLFITSKLWCTFHRPDLVEEACRTSIEELQCTYLDLYLIHWPMGYKEGKDLFPKDDQGKLLYCDIDYVYTWYAMEKVCRKGLTKSIGLSNFNKCQIERVLQAARIPPALLQIEVHPFFHNSQLIAFCREHSIQVTAYSPLGSGLKSLLTSPVLAGIAAKYGKSVPQILIRYPIDRGLVVLCKSVQRSRIMENIDIFDFQLTSEDMQQMSTLERGLRTCVHDNEMSKHKLSVADAPLAISHLVSAELRVAATALKANPKKVDKAIKTAVLECGYNHIDCAHIYGNEKEIGKALGDLFDCHGVKRKNLFITSKLWCTFHRPDRVEEACRTSIEDLRCKYLDLYLIHWPQGYMDGDDLFPKKKGKLIYSDIDYVHTWYAMEKINRKGLTKSIGISNFNRCQISRVLKGAKIPPATIQLEVHPFLHNDPLIDYCKRKCIQVQAYSPLGSGFKRLLQNPMLEKIAKKYNKSVPQILIRYPIDRGLVVLCKSTKRSRIRDNINVFDFQLTPEDMSKIHSLERNLRTCVMDDFDHKYNPFHDDY